MDTDVFNLKCVTSMSPEILLRPPASWCPLGRFKLIIFGASDFTIQLCSCFKQATFENFRPQHTLIGPQRDGRLYRHTQQKRPLRTLSSSGKPGARCTKGVTYFFLQHLLTACKKKSEFLSRLPPVPLYRKRSHMRSTGKQRRESDTEKKNKA